MQARVKWVEGLTFLGESASGHQVLMDGNSGDKAPKPDGDGADGGGRMQRDRRGVDPAKRPS